MAQGPVLLYESGLERDRRQDEAPTRYLGRQDEFPTARDNSGEYLNHVDMPVISQTDPNLPSHISKTETQRHICGLRVSMFWLVATVIVLLILTGVGMGVLGSKITSKRNDRPEQKCNSSQFSTSESAFLSSTGTATFATSSITSSPTVFPIVEPLQHPNNDCKAVQPQYTIKTAKGKSVNATFDISCDTEFWGGDFMSFYSPSLTTCIRGCAMFNFWQTRAENGKFGDKICSGITYLPYSIEEGNCYLKPVGYVSVVSRKTNITYAKLRLNNGTELEG